MGLKENLKSLRKKLAPKYKTRWCIILPEENKTFLNQFIDNENSDTLVPKKPLGKKETVEEKENNLSLISKIVLGRTVYLYKIGDELYEIQTDKRVTYKYRTATSTKVHLGDTGALFVNAENIEEATDEEINLDNATINSKNMKIIIESQINDAEKSYQDILSYVNLELSKIDKQKRKK